MTVVWYVHGAGASQNSFNWLRQHLPDHDARCFTYESDASVETCIESLSDALAIETTPVMLVGHSLGGIICRACATMPSVERLVTLAAPFGGLAMANFLSLFSNVPMYRSLQKYSPLLVRIRNQQIAAPHLAIVGTRGLPHMAEPNDGVVSVASQTALHSTAKYAVFDLNHFEVLLSPEVTETISDFMRRSV